MNLAMNKLQKTFLILCSAILVTSCMQKQDTGLTADAAKDSLNLLSLFSEMPGEEAVKIHCLTCHSLKYIEMQPAFPRKTWEKVVDKMIKNFGAPIPDSSVTEIVDYLVAYKQ